MSDCQFFDVEVAMDVGVNAAILFKSFCFWIKKNQSEDVNIKDGQAWSFASIKGLSELFPYLTEKQIRLAMDSLVKNRYLKKAQLCDNRVNRTMWYALDEKGECIGHKGRMQSPSRANGNAPEGASNLEDREKKIEKEDISTSLRSVDIADKPKKRKASRIPDDWAPSEKDVIYCRTVLPDVDPYDLAESFRLHYLSVPDSKGLRVDWSATWKTWVRNEKAWGRTSRKPPDSAKGLIQRSAEQADKVWEMIQGVKR